MKGTNRRETTAAMFYRVKRWSGIRPVSALTETSVIDAFLLGQRITLRRAGPEPMPEEVVDRVHQLRSARCTYPQISIATGLAVSTIGRIVRGERVREPKLERKAVCV